MPPIISDSATTEGMVHIEALSLVTIIAEVEPLCEDHL